MHRWLVVPSIAFHVGLVVALLFLGAWHLDKLDAGRRVVTLGYAPPPPPAAEGSPAAAKAAPFAHKKAHITHDLVVPPETRVKVAATDPIVATPTDDSGTGAGAGAGTGNGLGSGDGVGDGSGGGDGPCTADCGPPVVTTRPVEPAKVMVPPTVLMGLRIAGDTQMQPSSTTRRDMQFRRVEKLTATFQVCLDASGDVASARPLRATGYAEYDDALKAGIATWRYQPYRVGGHGIPACGIVTFVYTMR